MKNFKVLGFGHVGFGVQDVEKSHKFYQDMLGFQVAWEHCNENGRRSLLFIGNQSCVIEFLNVKEEKDDWPINHLSILVDDVEAAVAELKSKGIEFEIDVRLDPNLYPNGEKFAIFRGPDGERIQLEQIL